MTRRSSEDSLLAEIESVERLISAQEDWSPEDKALEKETDEIAKEDLKIVTEGNPETKKEIADEGDQNEKAMDNWPLTAQDKARIASKLVAIAKKLLDD